MKTKYILHGGFTSTDNELNRTFYEAISKDVPEGGNILLIYFSRTDEETLSLYNQDKERILAQAGDKNLDIVLATRENFADQVAEANALYMRGGDTDKLVDAIKTLCPDFKERVKGKIVSGSSAGAYAIASYTPGHAVDYMREGFGLIPARVVCHYGSKDLPPNEKSLAKLRETASEMELILLKDFEWVVREG